MWKIIRRLAITGLAVLSVSLVGCGGNKQVRTEKQKTDHNKIQIITTNYAAYDWTREIIGNVEGYELTYLLDNGTDAHSYQPGALDITRISDCDLLIYTGGESDSWVGDALEEGANPDMKVINLMEELAGEVKEEEVVEGMAEETHDEEESDGEEAEDFYVEEDSHQEAELDEHVWLSLRNAEIVCETLKNFLGELDKGNTQIFQSNYETYVTRLEQLDIEYEKAVSTAKRKVLLFADRFPFRYLVDDYNLDYHAAFPGCSAETEASFETIVFLSGKIDELDLPAVLVIENSGEKMAQTIVENTKSKSSQILTVNSLQSVTADQMEEGFTYIAAMENNLDKIKAALN